MRPIATRQEPFDDAGAVMGVMIGEPTTHFTGSELARELAWEPNRVEDALAELNRAGLVHQRGDFTFPTRAAVRYAEVIA